MFQACRRDRSGGVGAGLRFGVGRKAIEYQPEYAHWAHQVALLGGDDVHIAAMLEVSLQTVNRWKKQHREFAESIKDGQLKADLKVIQALHKSCLGYHATETETHYAVDADGNKRVVEVIEREIHIPPNFEACQFWLCNRQAERWKWYGRTAPSEPVTEQTPESLH